MNEHTVLALAGVGILASGCQWLAWRLKLPAILFLLLAGIAVGPALGWLDPNALFGDLLFPFVSLSVAVILFEGSLTLNFGEIRGLGRVVRNLITIGLLVTWCIISVATHLLLSFSWELSFLFGALVVVTGPTVIVPMLRTVRPNAAVANILRWEGIVIDPIGALLAVLVFEFILSSRESGALGHTLLTFGQALLAGFSLGVVCGHALGVALRRHWLPEYLHNVTTLTLVFAVFAVSNTLQEESGLLAVTVMGMWLANMRGVHLEDILNFKEHLSVFLISGLFIVLAARVEPAQVQSLGWGALGVLASIQLLARPLKVLVSTVGSTLTWPERALLGWIAPRGIVAAAVSALFALRLESIGFEQAPLLVPLTFIVIIGTVVLQSATARPLAKLLGVAEPEPRGMLIVGANLVARAVAKVLQDKGYRTLLTDMNWENIRAARMEGLSTFYGNPVSEYADQHLDLVGIGRLLALSPQGELNALASLRYRAEFGKHRVYTIPVATKKAASPKHEMAPQHHGNRLFGKEVTYAKLASLLSRGAEIRSTQLTESFGLGDFQDKNRGRAIPLFFLDKRNRLRIVVADGDVKPESGWTIISLIPADEPPDPAQTKAPGAAKSSSP